MAIRLAEVLGWTEKNWLGMQRVYDLWQARGGTGENKRLLPSYGMATGLFATSLTERSNVDAFLREMALFCRRLARELFFD